MKDWNKRNIIEKTLSTFKILMWRFNRKTGIWGFIMIIALVTFIIISIIDRPQELTLTKEQICMLSPERGCIWGL